MIYKKSKYTAGILLSLCLIMFTGCETMDENVKETIINPPEPVEKVEPGILPSVIDAEGKSFCGTWACSQYLTEPGNMPMLPLEHYSIRQTVKTSIPGKAIRIRFSNICGESELELKSVHVAFAADVDTKIGKIDTSTDTIVTFNGKKSVVIPAGEEIYSDTFEFDLPALSYVSVSMFFGKVPEHLTGHPGSRTTTGIELGNFVSQEKYSIIGAVEHWYVLAGIDVVTEEDKEAVVCFGDSITDGRGSTTDRQNRWTDNFSARLQSNEETKNLAVLNQGIGGTLVCSSGVNRFNQDVLSQCGATYILMLYGINDIIYANISADKLVDVYKGLIKKAHNAGKTIYGGTILPFGKCGDFTEAREAVRQSVNEWIRTTSADKGGFDGYVDFDEAMKDKDNPKIMKAEYNCGDGLHPSAKGYAAMGDAIDLSLFTKKSAVLHENPVEEKREFAPLTIESARYFQYSLPRQIIAGQKVEVHVKGFNSGSTGFRSWLIDNNQTTNSDLFLDAKEMGKGEFEFTYTLTATANSASLFFKGPVYGTNIEGIQISSLSVIINGMEAVFDPSEAVVTE